MQHRFVVVHEAFSAWTAPNLRGSAASVSAKQSQMFQAYGWTHFGPAILTNFMSLAAGACAFPRRSYRRAYPAANDLSCIFERIGEP
jgi:hypothetical protein